MDEISNLTISQIIEIVNKLLKDNAEKPIIKNEGYNKGYNFKEGRNFYTLRDVMNLLKENSLTLSLNDSRGIYLFTTENGWDDYSKATLSIKAKREKQDAWSSGRKADKQYYSIVSIELLTKTIADLTCDEVEQTIEESKNKKKSDESQKKINIYNEIRSELNKYGITAEQVRTLYKKIDSLGYYTFEEFEKNGV